MCNRPIGHSVILVDGHSLTTFVPCVWMLLAIQFPFPSSAMTAGLADRALDSLGVSTSHAHMLHAFLVFLSSFPSLHGTRLCLVCTYAASCTSPHFGDGGDDGCQ